MKQLRATRSLKSKSLSAKQLTTVQSISVRGGNDLEVYPWIDQPGG